MTMKDPALDLQINEVTLLMSELRSFRDIVVTTLNTEVVVPENEARLAKLKETIPEMTRKLYSDLCEDYNETPEKTVKGVESLPRLIKYTDLEKRKLMEAWHRYYMKLHFIIGQLKNRKKKVESLNLVQLKTRHFLLSPFTIIIVLAIIVFIVFVYFSQ